jgi:hypothetical protein
MLKPQDEDDGRSADHYDDAHGKLPMSHDPLHRELDQLLLLPSGSNEALTIPSVGQEMYSGPASVRATDRLCLSR